MSRLEPHEGHATDVVLLGHSMGGLVSAEVALSQLSSDPHSRMRHRIVGTINFDVPFLGMHPSVIKSGLASIFSPGPESPKPQAEAESSTSLHSGTMSPSPEGGNASTAGHASGPPALPPRRTDTLFSPQRPDPNYNPSFENDVILPMRKGWLNAWHFVSKHNDDLIAATKQLVKSHMEFGGAMADYSGLKNRYCRIRALEESNPDVRRSIMGGTVSPPRVRFVNYYTSSTGRPKKPKSPVVSPPLTSPNGTAATSMTSLTAGVQQTSSEPSVPVIEPAQIDADDHLSRTESHAKDEEEEDEESVPYDLEESNDALRQMDNLEPLPMSDYDGDSSDAESWTDAMEDLRVSDAPPAATDESVPANSTTSKQSPLLASATSLPDAHSLALTTPSANDSSSTLEPSLNTGPSSMNTSSLSLATTSSLPPIPEAPPKPTEPDFSVYIDKETRKIAEKDYSRVMKTYERAVKDRDRAIRDREKLEEKRKRAAIKEGKRTEQAEEKESKRKEKEREKEAKQIQKAQGDAHEEKFELQRRETEQEWKETLNMKWNAEDGTVVPMPQSSTASVGQASHSHRPSLAPSASLTTGTSLYSVQTGAEADAKPRKERTFCTLPPKDASGNRDPVWVKVFMPDVDEVGAHCGLFFETSPAYEQLVGDVGEKVAEWVAETESDRIALALAEE